jgi:c-di-GMP-binding flagellar brake protein YcgR
MFGRKPRVSKAKESVESLGVEARGNQPGGEEPTIDPVIFHILDRLEKVGAQLLVRLGAKEVYTTTVVGLGHDGFFIDTLTPPSGDARMQKAAAVEVESLLGGVSYDFSSRVISKVRFLDELPAFKLSYPTGIDEGRRRRSPRILAKSTASISFSRPFKCNATVHDISVGGLAFEYDAEFGRLANGTLLGGVLLEIEGQPAIEVHPEVVGNLVVELGGLSLPSRYRTSVSFTRIGKSELKSIESYIDALRNR